MASLQTTSYFATGNREGLTDVVADLFADEAPFFRMAKTIRAIATKHEWQSDNLNAAVVTGIVEGADIGYSQNASRARHGNYTHIRLRNWDVSFTQMKVTTAGIKNDVAREVLKCLKEIVTDYDKIFLNTGAPNP